MESKREELWRKTGREVERERDVERVLFKGFTDSPNE